MMILREAGWAIHSAEHMWVPAKPDTRNTFLAPNISEIKQNWVSLHSLGVAYGNGRRSAQGL